MVEKSKALPGKDDLGLNNYGGNIIEVWVKVNCVVGDDVNVRNNVEV